MESNTTEQVGFGLYTQTGHKLTIHEEKFIEEYLKCGNATKAYIIAYNRDEKDDSPKTRNFYKMANKVLNKSYILEEINNRVEMVKNETIADATEIMQYFTDVMRGNVKDQFGLEAPLAERTKAAQELAKRQIDFQQKSAQSSESSEMRITLDWAQPEGLVTMRDIMAQQQVTQPSDTTQ